MSDAASQDGSPHQNVELFPDGPYVRSGAGSEPDRHVVGVRVLDVIQHEMRLLVAQAGDLGALVEIVGLESLELEVEQEVGLDGSIAAVLGPILLDYAAQMGLPPLPAALSIAIGSSLVFFPYQSAPFVLAYSFRYVRMGQFILLMTLMSVLTLLILVPLNLLYWRLIGLI